MVGLDTETLIRRLRHALVRGDFDPECLLRTAEEYGTKRTQDLVRSAIEAAQVAA